MHGYDHFLLSFQQLTMIQTESQSSFLQNAPENQQTFFVKKITSMLQTDKENIITEKPKIQVNKMQIGENQVDAYLVDVGEMVKLKKETIRDIFKGLEKENKSKRIIIGLLGHRPQPISKSKLGMLEKPTAIEKSPTLLNMNILAKFKPEQYPYVSMFTCDCLMGILKMYVSKTQLREQDLKMRWRYDFILEDEKIGEVLVINDHKGDDVFANIAIRMKLSRITSDEQGFSRDLLEEFASRLNISMNLRESAVKIRQLYESHLMFLGEDVLVRTRLPNQWDDIVSGKFVRVNQVGHAILEDAQNNEEEIQDGIMELKKEAEQLEEEEEQQGNDLAEIGF